MTLELYTTPGTIGVATHIALEESGLPYESVKIDFAAREQLSDRYRQVNPKLRVPALLVDGEVLTETPAILVYLAQIAPASVLSLPADPMDFAHIQSFNSYLASTVHVAHAHKMRGARWTDNADALTAMTAYVPTSMTACFELIETTMLRGPWVHGGAFSISDPYLFALCQWLEGDGVDITRFPKIQAHHASMLERESVRRVLAAYSSPPWIGQPV
jgi:glutathione S-transferase